MSSAHPLIREATPDDHQGIARLILELNRFENRISGDRTTDRISAEKRCDDHFAQIKRGNGAVLLVAEVRQGIAGYLMMFEEMRPVFFRPEFRRVAYIAELCVAEAHRRQGIGGALLAAAESQARSRGIRFIGLTALDGNAQARAAYAKAGFLSYAVEMIKPLD
jgi:ribosomal protein S18 acetylase RimI-like enzyme